MAVGDVVERAARDDAGRGRVEALVPGLEHLHALDPGEAGVQIEADDPGPAVPVLHPDQGAPGQEQVAGKLGSPEDEAGAFVDVIETSTTQVWTELFSKSGEGYSPPEDVVIYDQATGTACGQGQAAMGPFYCPGDKKVYLDLAF